MHEEDLSLRSSIENLSSGMSPDGTKPPNMPIEGMMAKRSTAFSNQSHPDPGPKRNEPRSSTRQTDRSCVLGIQDCAVLATVEELRRECERLTELLHRDPLTGLFNLRHFMEALDQEMERTRRTGLPTGLIMIDLDHFKSVNDVHGHQCGNDALRWVAGILRGNVRRLDIPCRYGGEEFAVVLPATRLCHAVRLAERLRVAIMNSPLEYEGISVPLQASFGVDVYCMGENVSVTVEEFIRRTDGFLLQAKAQGRNMVCCRDADAGRPATEITAKERAALFITRWP